MSRFVGVATLLLAPILVVSGCAIDDRELEVTEGERDPACRQESGDNSCTECAKDECCVELVRCQRESECGALSECYGSCTDAACDAVCEDAYPDGLDRYIDLGVCLLRECDVACGG